MGQPVVELDGDPPAGVLAADAEVVAGDETAPLALTVRWICTGPTQTPRWAVQPEQARNRVLPTTGWRARLVRGEVPPEARTPPVWGQ